MREFEICSDHHDNVFRPNDDVLRPTDSRSPIPSQNSYTEIKSSVALETLEIEGPMRNDSNAGTPLLMKEGEEVNEKKMVIIAILVKIAILLILIGAGFLVYWKQETFKKWLKQFLSLVSVHYLVHSSE